MQNPLLTKSQLAFEAVPFNLIHTEHFVPALKTAIQEAKDKITQLKNNSEPANFENTLVALEQAGEAVSYISSVYFNLFGAEASPEFQALAQEISPMLSHYSTEISLDESLFARIKTVYDQRQQSALTPEQLRVTEESFKSFSRNGALLPEDKKNKLRKINEELATLGPKFSENILKATNAFELWIDDKNDLTGLPDSAIEAAQHAAEQKGKPEQWLFTLDAPSMLPLVTYADKRELREKIWRAYNSRGFVGEFNNQDHVKRIASLRFERAQTLGYSDHAAFILEERMAETPQKVMSFLDQLFTAAKPAAIKELEQVKKFAQELDGTTDLQPWDVSYYSEKLKQKLFNFNEEQLRPYFQLEKVVQGAFEHARKLYGIIFQERPDIPTYHADVKVYEVKDESTQEHVGLFYSDFFPRATKRNGAWMTNYQEQGLRGGIVRRPHVSIVCNFTKPTPTKPSLLTYDEVRTLFHEFGHSLHSILSNCTYSSVSGTNVYWDFVELPSQIMENWVGEKEGLDLFAHHYQTGEAIPQSYIDSIQKAAKFQAGWFTMRQLRFAYLDMAWHSGDPRQVTDVANFEQEAIAKTNLVPTPSNSNVSCAFSHIFAGGYSAGYYSYKWAEVLDADAFEYFLEKGLFNREVANSFKNNILSRGGTEHPMELYKKFRGREPRIEALLKRDGLLSAQ